MKKRVEHTFLLCPTSTQQHLYLISLIKMNKRTILSAISILLFSSLLTVTSQAQGGRTAQLYGDFKVDEKNVEGLKPQAFDLTLYSTTTARTIARQSVVNNGRYRFNDVPEGEYDLVIEMETQEVGRIHINIVRSTGEQRQDIELEWKSNPVKAKSAGGIVSVADIYKRTPANKKTFEKAEEALSKKEYEQAASLFNQLTTDDPKDYQAWTELGTAYLFEKNSAEAEKAYLRAIAVEPTFIQAYINLGRLRLIDKNFEGAIEILSKAVEAKPTSPDANYYLGEAYLQIKKGSKAVGYLYEAIRLDPVGKAEAHLRLALLYIGAGLKDKAAAEYEEFLKKRPDYPDKKRLQQYIDESKKH